MHIGIKIKRQREKLGMSQQELADLVGYKSRSAINKIELGKNGVSEKRLSSYSKALKVPISYFTGELDLNSSISDESNPFDKLPHGYSAYLRSEDGIVVLTYPDNVSIEINYDTFINIINETEEFLQFKLSSLRP